MEKKYLLLFVAGFFVCNAIIGQTRTGNDVNTPLHALQVDYPVPYGAPKKENVKSAIDKVFNYLNAVTPAQLLNKQTGEELTNISSLDTNTVLKQGDFR